MDLSAESGRRASANSELDDWERGWEEELNNVHDQNRQFGLGRGATPQDIAIVIENGFTEGASLRFNFAHLISSVYDK